MNIISWNCRGLGIPRSVRALTKLVRTEAPLLIFLVETKAKVPGVARLQAKLDYTQGIIVPSNGKSGGLALLWKEGTNVWTHKYSNSHIDVVVTDTTSNMRWRATGFYGHPDTKQRHISWKLLERLNSQLSLPWLVFGDFNEITHLEEKCGWAERNADQMMAFRNALNACNLQDLGFIGSNYTWCNGRFGSQRTLIRLDRMVANTEWRSLFQGARVYHKSMAASDHCALVLHMKTGQPQRRKKPRFRFESMWLRDPGCREVVELAWDATNPSGDLTTQDRIKNCQNQVRWWNTNVFGHVNKQLQKKQEQLQHLESLNTLHDFTEDIALLRKEINELLDRENDMWWQRSRALWMQQGDRNTKFFHSTASQRRQKNTIVGIQDEQGNWMESDEDIERIVLEYYQSIYQSDMPSGFDAVMQAIEPKVTPEMNASLTKEFRPDEVWTALQQMHPLKSPGPDGMPPIFYQKFWNIVGPNVIECVLNILNYGIMPPDFNATHICLIPKRNNP